MPRVIAVTGPTASGKSRLAMDLCRIYDGEIVSFDSMQIYRGMNIGTAKPSFLDMAEIRHHMIDVFEPWDNCSVAEFVHMASAEIDDILSRGKTPVLCGGTGLYLDSYVNSREFGNEGANEKLREELTEYAKLNGNHAVHEMLRELDPEAAESIHENNLKRVIRAIEICKTSGMTKTEWDKKADSGESRDVLRIVIDYRDRKKLYKRIDDRIDTMIDDGLLNETKQLIGQNVFEKNTTAAQAIGYKELFPYINGESTLDECVEKLKNATHHYAKRQETWFKKSGGNVIFADDYEEYLGMLQKAKEIINNQ